jgi:hypothetical protein
MRKTKLRGLHKVDWAFTFTATAYNLVRLPKLLLNGMLEKVMSALDFVEAWWLSVHARLESYGVLGRFEKSPSDRPNPSCSLNLRRGEQEADLLGVWRSGVIHFRARWLRQAATFRRYSETSRFMARRLVPQRA